MTGPPDPRLQRLLGGAHLAALRGRLRRRFERAPPDRPLEQIRVDGLRPEEHAALASLTGRPQKQAASMSIDLRQVDAALREAGIATSLRDALERLDGGIVHLATRQARLQAAWSQVVEGRRDADLANLLRDATGLGLLKRLTRQDPAAAAELCRRAEAVLRRLPAGGLARSRLAADVLGDAHALDAGQAVATLVLATRRRLALPAHPSGEASVGSAGRDDVQLANERARDIWAAAGVLVNELARPALFLNLPVKGGMESQGEPGYASLRRLLRAPPAWEVAGRDVHVCENPNLVAIAADRLGRDCAPLVCTDGMPAAAQRTLLLQLARAQARLHYHGDFDWPGLRIANHVVREHGARPWRMGVADYLAAVRNAPSLQPSLHGKPVAACWDDALAPAMEQHRLAIAEEALADELLRDLERR